MALVLSRKPSEEIIIGDNIKVSVLGVRDGKTVSIAVTAPKDVSIVRAEVRDKAKRVAAVSEPALEPDTDGAC